VQWQWRRRHCHAARRHCIRGDRMWLSRYTGDVVTQFLKEVHCRLPGSFKSKFFCSWNIKISSNNCHTTCYGCACAYGCTSWRHVHKKIGEWAVPANLSISPWRRITDCRDFNLATFCHKLPGWVTLYTMYSKLNWKMSASELVWEIGRLRVYLTSALQYYKVIKCVVYWPYKLIQLPFAY